MGEYGEGCANVCGSSVCGRAYMRTFAVRSTRDHESTHEHVRLFSVAKFCVAVFCGLKGLKPA